MSVLGPDVQGALLEMRQAAEALMIDACRITRDGEPVWDEETGENAAEQIITYEGKCRLRLRDTQPQDLTQAGIIAVVVEFVVSIPVTGTEDVAAGQTVEMTVCLEDSALVGRRYRIGADLAGSLMTARRLPVKEVQPT